MVVPMVAFVLKLLEAADVGLFEETDDRTAILKVGSDGMGDELAGYVLEVVQEELRRAGLAVEVGVVTQKATPGAVQADGHDMAVYRRSQGVMGVVGVRSAGDSPVAEAEDAHVRNCEKMRSGEVDALSFDSNPVAADSFVAGIEDSDQEAEVAVVVEEEVGDNLSERGAVAAVPCTDSSLDMTCAALDNRTLEGREAHIW